MERILIAGMDTVVGGNLAAWLANRYEICGLAWARPVSVAGCRTVDSLTTTPVVNNGFSSPVDPLRLLEAERPARVVYCGVAAEPAWNLVERQITADTPRHAAAWAAAAQAGGAKFTYISSDAVFTGPWLFHREQGTCFCNSQGAKWLRAAERDVTEAAPESLIVRTQVFGWSPVEARQGLVERIVGALRDGDECPLDYLRHATPILATDLADLLDAAFQKQLTGLYHIAGGERVNPFRFACLLADEFNLETSGVNALEIPLEQRKAFAGGETSLQTRRVKKALEMSVPLLRDGLARLREQDLSGYRDRFECDSWAMSGKAA